jgi:hypothetical protein
MAGDGTRPGTAYQAGAQSPVIYRAGRRTEDEESRDQAGTGSLGSTAVIRLLAMILVAPAGTKPTNGLQTSNISSVVKSPNSSGNTSSGNKQSGGGDPGDPGVNAAPEPASLTLALLGIGLSKLAEYRRRRRNAR